MIARVVVSLRQFEKGVKRISKLAEIRRQKGYSQEALSAMSGVHRVTGSLGCDLTPQGLGASPLGTGAGNSADWAASPVTEPREAVVLVLHSLTHTLGACPSRHVAHTHLGFENQVSGRTWLSSLVWFLHFFFSLEK